MSRVLNRTRCEIDPALDRRPSTSKPRKRRGLTLLHRVHETWADAGIEGRFQSNKPRAVRALGLLADEAMKKFVIQSTLKARPMRRTTAPGNQHPPGALARRRSAISPRLNEQRPYRRVWGSRRKPTRTCARSWSIVNLESWRRRSSSASFMARRTRSQRSKSRARSAKVPITCGRSTLLRMCFERGAVE